jgi:FKBP-type peptidyl-prolyl cis-trans isomerase
VTNFRVPHTIRARAAVALATLGTGALLAACGSSGSGSTITIGNENSGDQALAKAGATTPTTPTTTTPTSGPLSKEPKITPPAGAPPTKLVTRNLITGTGAEAKTGGPAAVNYVGALFYGGKVFDASWKRNEPFTFTLGKGQVIQGWEQGVPGMKVGGRRELIVPAELAYGAKGAPPSIPPNAPLVFVIDLLAT